MKIKELEKYKPITFKLRKRLSDHEMKSNSEQFYENISSRHTIREFNERKIPFSIIKNCINAARLAPSGANQQPWHFTVISNSLIKSEIRKAAEKEERKFYNKMKNDEWIRALEPLGTNSSKPHLEKAPWLIVVFSERYGVLKNGKKFKHYYVPESVGISIGFLITALHLSGLYCLTHTPNPMGFLTKICKRPSSNKPILILAVGHPEKNATIPLASTIKKKIDDVMTILD